MARSEASVYIDGPWSHRSVSANGTRFHIAESGDGPLVLLLHGFPEFWWTWRRQLSTLSEAGFRAVAVDLRGYGGSDKPPRGYDLVTAASDAAGMIRSLGEANAVVVGHDWGGMIAWTMAAYFPKVITPPRGSSRPPIRSGCARRCSPIRWVRAAAAVRARFPDADAARAATAARRRRARGRAASIRGLVQAGPIRRPSGSTARRCPCPRWPTPRLSITAGCSGRGCGPTGCATPAPCGRRSRHRRCRSTAGSTAASGRRAARGSGAYVEGPYRWRLIDGAGHFPHEEMARPVRPRAAVLAARSRARAVTLPASPAGQDGIATLRAGRGTPGRGTASAGR